MTAIKRSGKESKKILCKKEETENRHDLFLNRIEQNTIQCNRIDVNYLSLVIFLTLQFHSIHTNIS